MANLKYNASILSFKSFNVYLHCVAVLRAVHGPLVIDSIMGAIFRRAVLHRENCDSGGSGFSCNSSRPLGGVRSDLHGRTTFSHILHMDTYEPGC